MKPRNCLFAEHERQVQRSSIGDPLVGLTKHVDFEALAARIDNAVPRLSRANGGRPAYPTVLIVKVLVLQQLYYLADDALEYQLLDRRSFLQFLDLIESGSISDAKAIRLFHDRLAQAGAGTLVLMRSSSNCIGMITWPAAARSLTLPWCRRRYIATNAKKPTPSKRAHDLELAIEGGRLQFEAPRIFERIGPHPFLKGR